MRLHEHYFESLGGKAPLDITGPLAKMLTNGFGSVENWEKDFRAWSAVPGRPPRQQDRPDS